MIREKYDEIKRNNKESLVAVKSGNFYITFDLDAQIMNLLFNYKIVRNKVGFPVNIRNKIIDTLNIDKINYVIYEGNNTFNKKEFENNSYLEILRESKKVEYRNSMKKLLFDRIEFLIDTDHKNYEKITDFIEKL